MRRPGRHPAVLSDALPAALARLRAALALHLPHRTHATPVARAVVRGLSSHDAPSFATLHGAGLAPPDDPRVTTLGALCDGALVGTCSLRRDGRVGWILALTVAPAWRGRGVGAALVRASVHVARTWGLDAVRARVSIANTPSRRVFARAGFVESRTDDPVWGEWSRALP